VPIDGDIAYADYWLKESVQQYLNVSIDQGVTAYENLLNEFYDQMSPITALVPYMVSPGNHEADCKLLPCFRELVLKSLRMTL
jgi:hypothetical protein